MSSASTSSRRKSQSRRSKRTRARRIRRARWALVPVGLIAVLVAVALFDNARRSDEVLRNVSLAGVSISGQNQAELRETIAALQAEIMAQPVELVGDGNTAATTAGAVGLSIDVDATVADALDTGRGGLSSPFSWIGGIVRDREAPLRMTIDDNTLAQSVAEFGADANDPVRFKVNAGLISVAGGDGGSTVDLAAARDSLLRSATRQDNPIRSELVIVAGLPVLTADEAAALAAAANAATSNGIRVTVAGQSANIDAETLRHWLRPDVDNRSFVTDTEAAVAELRTRMTVGASGSDATFTVEGNTPVISGGAADTACCAPDSGARIDAALKAAQPAVELALAETPRTHGREWAASLGIKELVAEFTTNYPPRQPRVVNIKRISELTRGAIIEPGGTFSINDYVGRRTTENGFVPAGSIQNGVFEDSIGGGISQYATTLFNAAFFGGLDFAEYQSHSIYISRYPYGREATVSFPKPDLKITNTTPHGILLWPIAGDNGITVKLFSTKFVSGEQTNQTKRAQGAACTKVTTERTRTYVDGRPPVVDSVTALYRPEGIACSGASTVPTAPPPPAPPPTVTHAPEPPPAETPSTPSAE